jgi:hypothetical protein
MGVPLRILSNRELRANAVSIWFIAGTLVLALTWTTAIGLFLRWRWSRWIGAGYLVLLAIIAVRSTTLAPPTVSAFKGVDTSTDWYHAGRVTGIVLFAVGTLSLAGVLMMKSSAKDYFCDLNLNKPNQLPDPTSPSVTPPAGAGRAPSVAADH